MRLTFRLILILVLIFVLSSCQTKSSVEKTNLLPNTLADAAYQTSSSYGRAVNAGKEILSTEIPERYWAQAIRDLKPIKVYTHMVNIVVAQKVRYNMEEGKYIYIHISSYLPMDGVDGFAYKPNPLKGNQYHLGDGIFDYQRAIKN